MAHVPFTANETNEGKPIRRALWKKVKDNDDDREFRIDGIEGKSSSSLIDHFDWTTEAIGVSTNFDVHSSKWTTAVEGTASVEIVAGTHMARLQAFSATHLNARMRGNYIVEPDRLPRMKCRTKFDHNVNPIGDFYWGFQSDRALATTLGNDVVALWNAEANPGLKFVVRKNGGSVTEGVVDITRPLEDSYFTFEIRYVDTDTVDCFFNGALVETFHGPGDEVPDGVGDTMFPEFHNRSPASPTQAQNLDLDWVEVRDTIIADS